VFRIVLSSLLVAAFGVGGWFLWSYFQPAPAEVSDSPKLPAVRELKCERSVYALGYLLPQGGIVSVNSTPGDQLGALEVQEDEVVTPGQLLGKLQSEPLRLLEWQAQKAQAEQAARQLKAELVAAEKRIVSAKVAQEKLALQKLEEAVQQAQIDFLKANLVVDKRNRERLKGVSESLVSVQKREQQELLVEKTTAELEAAERKLEGMIASREYSEKAAKAELAVAEAGRAQVLAADQTESLKLAAKIAGLRHEQTLLKAPIAGTVLKTFVKPGETLGAKPILQVANLDHMICQAEVFETDIQCVHVGQTVRVTSPAFPRTGDLVGISGTVKRISSIVSAPELQSLDPYAAADRHVVGVEIEFDHEASRIARHFVNLQVQVEFLPESTP
jgi:HlyD family secretion protein